MDSETYGFLKAQWVRELPGVPWPFDLSADPQAVVTSLGAHLEVRHRQPPLRVTLLPPLVLQSTPPAPTKGT